MMSLGGKELTKIYAYVVQCKCFTRLKSRWFALTGTSCALYAAWRDTPCRMVWSSIDTALYCTLTYHILQRLHRGYSGFIRSLAPLAGVLHHAHLSNGLTADMPEQTGFSTV